MQTENQTSKIKPADRLASVSEYYFSKKLKEVAQMNAEGKDVISLGIGSPDMPPSEATIQTLCREAQNPDGHGYMPYVGIPELRRSFAAWYKKWYGVELNPNTEIQPLIGSKEGILHVTLAFVNPGEQVLVPNPGYPTYTSLSKILGAEVINYNLKEENGWMPDFNELEKMDMSRVKLMWTNYPNMPTGANATPELYAKLVDFAHRKDIVIVNDNPYSFILNDHPLSILSVPGAKECCIEFNSMSKSHNMPGWRIGMLASNRVTSVSTMDEVKRTAQQLGVAVKIDGYLPRDTAAEGLTVAAAKECVTNCIKHADGNEVYIRIAQRGERYDVTITNNGKIPTEPIKEGSGLSTLRRSIESSGGEMHISHNPRFALLITIPAKEISL